MGDSLVRLNRRRFLAGAGALTLASVASPAFARQLWTPAGALDPDAGTGFSAGVASFDPTPDTVLLWTRPDEPADTSFRVVAAQHPGVPPASLAGLPAVAEGQAQPNGDGTVVADVTGLPEPGTFYWYQFFTGSSASAVGRTKTLPVDADGRLRLAVTSCQDWQQGWYTVWRDIAGQDLDLVVFLGDYIYEYESYLPTERRTWPRIHVDEDGNPVGEARTLADYRWLYRLYRSDPDLRAAHRMHPFACVWDDHEVAGDRWDGGAVNHDEDDEQVISYAEREAGALQAYFEYLPARADRPDPRGVQRVLRAGALADLVLLDTRTYRSPGVGGTNRDFDPAANLDEPALSDPDRTMLGTDQKAWLKDALRAAGARWKLIGNQVMLAPLNIAVLPDAVSGVVAELSQREDADPLPLTYHRDGIPVNSDQWDGFHAERRELLGFLRGDEGSGPVADTVVLTGDIHTGWCNELHVEQGDAPVTEPVAVELVCPGISSENFNERIGMLTIGRPAPQGSTNPVGIAAMSINRHVRYVDFDANGYVLVDVTADRVRSSQRILVNPTGADPAVNPVENHNAVVTDAVNGRFEVRRGRSRLLPALP